MPSLAVGPVVTLNRNRGLEEGGVFRVVTRRVSVMTCLIPGKGALYHFVMRHHNGSQQHIVHSSRLGLQLKTCTVETKPFQSRLETFSGKRREDCHLTEALSTVQTPDSSQQDHRWSETCAQPIYVLIWIDTSNDQYGYF